MSKDIDILVIDSQIRNNFQQQKENLEIYKNRLNDITEILKKKDVNIRIQNQLLETKNILEKCIDNIITEKEYNFYVLDTITLLEKYKEILDQPQKINFMGKPSKCNIEKNKIIEDYLQIAQKYIDLEIEKNTRKNIVCKNCDNKKDFDIIDQNIYICTNCYSQQTIMKHVSTYNDIDRINISSKYMYDRKVHFRDCIKQYQGKQNSTIPSKLYDEIINELDNHHILLDPPDLPKKERFSNVTKNHILLFLKELGYSNHYENVHLIHKNITDKDNDDITYLEEKLMDDFDVLTDLYDKHYKNLPRKNFINTQYVLYQLLCRHKHPCKKEEFIILKTIDRKFFHDEICKHLFESLGWNHTPFY